MASGQAQTSVGFFNGRVRVKLFQCAFLSGGPYHHCSQYWVNARHHAGVHCDRIIFSVWGGNQSAQGGWHIVEFLGGCDHRFQRVTGKPVEFGIYQRGSADAFGLCFLFQLCGWLAA